MLLLDIFRMIDYFTNEPVQCMNVTLTMSKQICLYCFFNIKVNALMHRAPKPAWFWLMSDRINDILTFLRDYSAYCSNDAQIQHSTWLSDQHAMQIN